MNQNKASIRNNIFFYFYVEFFCNHKFLIEFREELLTSQKPIQTETDINKPKK